MRSYRTIQRATLPAVVFLTGACILVVEILATRILAPYFGSTIYTVSSVIGVVLAALSLGYYLGGRLSDARPSSRILYALIFFGGVSVLALEVLLLLVMPVIGYRLPIVWGPLVSSLLLFFLPSLLLGCLSPFAITLQKKDFPEAGIGTLSGEIFFWSTIGSIAGSLLSGFFLIPRFGTHAILLGVGMLLTFLGAAGVSVGSSKKKRVTIGIAALCVVIFFSTLVSFLARAQAQQYTYVDDGVYERIAIFDGEDEGKPARFLTQDRSSSSAMYVDSDELVFEYTRYITLAGLVMPDARETLVLGAGAYSVPKELLRMYPAAHVDAVDIEPDLYPLARRFFRVTDDSRLTPITDDARRFLHATPKQYDVVFSDIYASLYSLPVHTTTREFFRDANSALAPNGIFIANVIGSLSRTQPSIVFSLMRTMREEFDTTYFFAVDSPVSISVQNIIFVGIKGAKKIEFDSPAIAKSTDPIIRGLASHAVDLRRYDLSMYPVFTDTYAPVERATATLFRMKEDGQSFSGTEAFELIRIQHAFGPRFVGSLGHLRVRDFIETEIRALADESVLQEFNHQKRDGTTITIKNVIARFAPEQKSRTILATHYDTNPAPPTGGANNGASGVAVLLEIARVLAQDANFSNRGIDLVFFDAEEGEEGVKTETWTPLGSEYFATHLDELYGVEIPSRAIVVDMVCEKGMSIPQERTSFRQAPAFANEFWQTARDVAPRIFSERQGYAMIDDHTALATAGIPSILLIDFDYPWNYSTRDTPDKCSAQSLQAVGGALLAHLRSLDKKIDKMYN